ncbi:MAG: hypothetical protein ACYCSS_14300 [Sulfuriferula sp.]
MSKDIKVLVTVTPSGNPELFAALQSVPTRLRAERFRLLATLGLTQNGFGMTKDSRNAADTKPEPDNQSKAANAAKKLGKLF